MVQMLVYNERIYIIDTCQRELIMHTQTTIQQWGNSLALRLSGPLRSILQFEAGMKVNIEISDHELRIQPIRKKKNNASLFTEEELLKNISAKNIHADLLASPSYQELAP